MIRATKVILTAIQSAGKAYRVVQSRLLGRAVTVENPQAAPHGIDSNPVKDMVAIRAETGIKGEAVVIGYLNPNALAAQGENRIYSTDSNGNVVQYFWLKNDGTTEINGTGDFLARFNELKAGFDQLRDDFNTHVQTYNTHLHPGVATGLGNTGPTPSTGTPSTASIDTAKIDELKTTSA